MSKKKQKKKNMSALLLLLFLTVVMLATATYAWFTANMTVSIDDIDVNVAAQGGIQISVNASDWKTQISNDDIKSNGYSGNVNQFSDSLEPVSTIGDIYTADGTGDDTSKKGQIKMFKGTVENSEAGNFILTAASVKDEQNDGETNAPDYIAFDVFIKKDTTEYKDLYLVVGSGAVATSGKKSNGIENAARIAIVTEGNATSDTAVSTLTALNAGSDIKILEPNYNVHTEHGVTQAGLYYTDYTYTPIGTETGISKGSNNGYLSYDGVKAVITTDEDDDEKYALALTNATDNSDKFATVTTIHLDDKFVTADASASNYKIYENFPSGVTKLRIYMWIEGQDVDCEDNASGSDITFSLSFSLNA